MTFARLPSRRVGWLLLMVACLVGLGWRGAPGAGSAIVRGQAEDEAAGLLRESAAAMAALESFHFEITTPRGETVVLDSFELLALEGDVQRPDRFRAALEARAAVLDVSVDVVGVGSRLWVSDPMSAEGAYFEFDVGQEVGAPGESPADLLNPDRLLLRAVELIEEPSVNGRDEIDGVAVTRVDGRFDPSRVTDGGTPPAVVAGEALPIAIWIDDEGRVRRLEVAGPLLATEGPEVVRRLDLSAFDEPVVIEAPVG